MIQKKKDFNLSFGRLPIPDEKSPLPKDFDDLVNRLKDQSQDTPTIFNCQMGKGRTTTGMIVACIVREELFGKSDSTVENSDSKETKLPYTDLSAKLELRQGNFVVVQQLLEEFKEVGLPAKKQVDYYMDLNGPYIGLQNLREVIMWTKSKYDNADENKKPYWISMGKNFLERYYYLICFSMYAKEAKKTFELSFVDWLKAKPAVTDRITKNLSDFKWE